MYEHEACSCWQRNKHRKQSSAPEMFPDECRQIPEGNRRHILSFFLHIVNRLLEQMEEGESRTKAGILPISREWQVGWGCLHLSLGQSLQKLKVKNHDYFTVQITKPFNKRTLFCKQVLAKKKLILKLVARQPRVIVNVWRASQDQPPVECVHSRIQSSTLKLPPCGFYWTEG